MPLKILHTGDLHIGMKFNNYPDYIRQDLIEARFKVLENMINLANEKMCNIFVVAGDLFDKLNIPRKDVVKVINILDRFSGDCVLILPGNHDYDNGMVDLWEIFKKNLTGKMVLLNECKAYNLQKFDLDLVVYPAPCHKKHSAENNLAWIGELEEREATNWQIGIAHGALEGISPDLAGEYFNMREEELNDLQMDLWLLGHTHLPYPDRKKIINRKIFNAGTPEPDGMDCRHKGSAWFITLAEDKITAHQLQTGIFHFRDLDYSINSQADMQKLKGDLIEDNPGKGIVRITLQGRLAEENYRKRNELYRELKDELAYLSIDDSRLGMKISKDVIDREFSEGSFPHRLLSDLAEEEDRETLQIAYGLIKEVKDEAV